MIYRATRPRGRPWQMERNLLRPFIVRFWRRAADSLAASDWDTHRKERRKQKTRLGRKPCDLTLNLELSRAKQMLTLGVDEGLLAAHPLRKAKRVKTRTRRGSWFTPEQIHMLIEAHRALRWDHQRRNFRAWATVMGKTGTRISEALSIRWDRITLDGATTVIGKGNKPRVIGFPSEALEAMAALDRHPSCPFVFVNWRTGKPYDQSTVRAWFQTAVQAAGLESVKARGDFRLVPHIMRHSAASMADSRGAPLQWIQNMLGHAHPETTLIYLHRDEESAALRMARIMSDRKPRRAPLVRGPRRAAQKSERLRDNPEKELVKRDRGRVVSFS